MHNDQEQDTLANLTGMMVGQSLDHFDPFQGLTDHEEKAEQLRNMRYGFRIGGQHILIDSHTLCEVVQNVEIYRIPNTRPWVLGVINLRGNLVPVFDFLKRLDNTAVHADDQRLLVLDQGERAVGIYIDGLPQALQIDPDEPEQRAAIPIDLPESIHEHVNAAFRYGEQVWLEVDHRELFAELLADSGMNTDTLSW
ncbi:twitching motility protein PilI [Methylohalomonas lacus]|uniref:Twitching motility protein PilI n=1 Tax=Methylohalomonas lacus TaxID=398773 RepID=A0AAE3HJX4_9GAMM|nr:chemotaxis protein CheW [Methylohalomonas lacus]MCS3902491.1 twitching motility protein PilI [Methylohalomonas lacus]